MMHLKIKYKIVISNSNNNHSIIIYSLQKAKKKNNNNKIINNYLNKINKFKYKKKSLFQQNKMHHKKIIN